MEFEVTSSLAAEDRKLIRDGVLVPLERFFKVDVQPLGVLARDGGGTVRGGLVAHTVASWLSVDLVWVDEPLRQAGIGSELVRRAEAAAVARGCIGSHVSTGSFEAPGFYRRLGYTEFGSIPDFPPGHRRLWFYKRLNAGAATPPSGS